MAISLRDPRLYIFVIGILLIIALILVYPSKYSNDVKGRIEEAQQNLELKQADLATLQSRTAEDMAVIEQEINLLEQQLGELDMFLPAQYDQDDVLAMLSDKADNSGLTIVALTPLPPGPQGEYLVYSWQVQMTGQFHRLGVFLDQLTQQIMMTSVSDLAVQQQKASDGSFDNMQASFTINAFVQP